MSENSPSKPEHDGTTGALVVTLAARTRELEQTQSALAQSIRRYDDLVEDSRSIMLEREQLEAMVELRTAELALRNRDLSVAAERMAVAARAAKLGVWEWDMLQNRLFWDDTMYTLYGAQRDDFGANYEAWSRSLHPDDHAHVQQAIDLAVRGEREYEVEFRIVRPDGSIRHIQASGLTSFQESGKPLRMIGVNVDVTERKQAEALRAQLEEQLRVSQRMDAVGSLAGGIAHDFNNLLGLVLSYTDFVVAKVEEGNPMLDDLMEIKRAGERAATLTRQLVAFSRKQVLQPVPLSLNDIALELEKMLRRILGEDIELRFALAPDLGVVRADAAQIEQVLMNLIVNARDAMPRGGKLTIETANVELDARWARHHPTMAPGAYVRMIVSDTGTGIDRALQTRIFEPFFTTKERGKGTGLGLSMVYGIITQSGGHILVDSTVGSGTSFAIYLPRQQAMEAPTLKRAPAKKAAGGSETILVVEDEEGLLRAAVRALTSAGYTVVPAGNGAEALLACSSHDGALDLILTDVVMPQIGGATLVTELCKLRPELKVLYMSGYTDDAIFHHGVSEMGPPLLSKPFTARDLVRKVREVLDASDSARPTPRI